MSNARNISKAESRFVNATGDDLTGDLRLATGSSGTRQKFIVGRTTSGDSLSGVSYSHDDRASLGLQIRTDEVFSGAYPITLTTSGSASPDLTVDASGRVTKPYQPAFLASLSSNFTGAQYVNYLTFGTTEYNVGNHYSTSTGRFTAPISGLYQFILKLHTNTNTFTEVKIYKNGSEAIRCYNPTGGNSALRTGWAIGVVNLSSGDYVQGVFYDGSAGSGTVQGGNDVNNGSSTFQGYLLG